MLSVVKAKYHHPVKPWEEHSSGLAGEGRAHSNGWAIMYKCWQSAT